jgi:hypothetical protein
MHVTFFMNSYQITTAALLCAASFVFEVPAMADAPTNIKPRQQKATQERLVFVTGSLIPKRVNVQRIGTKTVSPLRVIDRTEIDQNGRQMTHGILTDDPSISVIGR